MKRRPGRGTKMKGDDVYMSGEGVLPGDFVFHRGAKFITDGGSQGRSVCARPVGGGSQTWFPTSETRLIKRASEVPAGACPSCYAQDPDCGACNGTGRHPGM